MTPIVFLLNRILYRVVEFLRHWYVGSFYAISHQALNVLRRLDAYLALKITFRYWLKPLYQDYTPLGYILGFILRTGRIIAGSIVYLVVIAIAAAVYIGWAVLPVYIIYQGI